MPLLSERLFDLFLINLRCNLMQVRFLSPHTHSLQFFSPLPLWAEQVVRKCQLWNWLSTRGQPWAHREKDVIACTLQSSPSPLGLVDSGFFQSTMKIHRGHASPTLSDEIDRVRQGHGPDTDKAMHKKEFPCVKVRYSTVWSAEMQANFHVVFQFKF